jgi:hypothetical protein
MCKFLLKSENQSNKRPRPGMRPYKKTIIITIGDGEIGDII